jgi:class 3 adenylate cyclase
VRIGDTRYTSVGDAEVAYQVTDTGGPIDFVYMIGEGSAFETWWDHPIQAKQLERYASFGRLILFDRRGSGLSDRPPADRLPSWEHFTEDLESVLDAAGSERAAILAGMDGGPIAMTFAAMHPERVSALMLWHSWAKSYASDDYPIGSPPEELDALLSIAHLWGTEEFTAMVAPDEADDPTVMRWMARSQRTSVSPQSWGAQTASMMVVDARPALPLITAPTLVMRRRDCAWARAALSDFLVENIADARLVEFDGRGVMMYGVQSDEIVATVEEFVTGTRTRARVDRVLATVLFTDIVGSTQRASELGDASWKALLAMHDDIARLMVEEWRGELVKTTGDGMLARFDGPGRAIGCALDLMKELRRHEIEIRSGVHVGEIELREDGDIGGIAVHIAARIQAKAGPGELLCSRTVKDLTAGSDISFEDRGTHKLKGIPDDWQLHAVV